MQYITLRDITFFSNFSHSEIYMSTGLAEVTAVISGDKWKFTLQWGRDDDDKLHDCSVKIKYTAELIHILQPRSQDVSLSETHEEGKSPRNVVAQIWV